VQHDGCESSVRSLGPRLWRHGGDHLAGSRRSRAASFLDEFLVIAGPSRPCVMKLRHSRACGFAVKCCGSPSME
jgi:hypothetical protein